MRKLLLLVVVTISAQSAVITFEGAAVAANSIVNVTPATPYREAGFTLTPANGNSAIFDSQRFGTVLPGDSTTVFGFSSDNVITLTGPSPFDLSSVIVGRLSYLAGPGNLNVTIVGNLAGGGTDMVTFTNLASATQTVIGLRNLLSARFTGTNNVGLDDISVTATVPEPGDLFAFGVVLLIPTNFVWRGLRRGYTEHHTQPSNLA